MDYIMSSMNISLLISDDSLESAAVKPFVIFRDHVRPALETRRMELEGMYAQVIGRPEIDPVFLHRGAGSRLDIRQFVHLVFSHLLGLVHRAWFDGMSYDHYVCYT